MNIPFINGILSYLQGDGAAILPEMELVLFGLGILLIDFWIEQKDKYWNAGLALAGTIFSGFTIFRLRGAIVAKGDVFGFHDSVVVDPFFIFFAALFLAATALVILLSVKFLEIEQEQEGEYYALLLFACVGMMFMASGLDRKSTRLNSSHGYISYAVFCLKKKAILCHRIHYVSTAGI